MARKILACAASDMSPISSSNPMPPAACCSFPSQVYASARVRPHVHSLAARSHAACQARLRNPLRLKMTCPTVAVLVDSSERRRSPFSVPFFPGNHPHFVSPSGDTGKLPPNPHHYSHPTPNHLLTADQPSIRASGRDLAFTWACVERFSALANHLFCSSRSARSRSKDPARIAQIAGSAEIEEVRISRGQK